MQKSELFAGGKILICVDVVNSRYKAKGLTSYLRAMLNIDPAKTHDWYLFCNKSCTRIKILHYDHKSVWFIERELLDGSRYPPAAGGCRQRAGHSDPCRAQAYV